MSKRILLLASGTGSLARAILQAHQEGTVDANFVGLISDKDSPALALALEFNIPAIFLPMVHDRKEWDRQIFESTEDLEPDLVVSVGFMRILAPWPKHPCFW